MHAFSVTERIAQISLIACAAAAAALPVHAAAVLTLAEAEALALTRDAVTARLAAEQAGLRDSAVAEGALPDPQLLFGPLNLPVDTFALDQEPMTQIMVGVRQQFPAGDSRRIAREQLDVLAAAHDSEIANQRRQVVALVRKAWLERFYADRAIALVGEEEAWFRQLEDAVTAAYASGDRRQHDIYRVELESELLVRRRIELENAARAQTGRLAHWLDDDARRPIPELLPTLPPIGEAAALAEALAAHPLLAADATRVEAGVLGENLERQRYRPAWALEVRYGLRDGTDTAGRERPDFLSAMVSFTLPVFTERRQDRRLSAATARTLSLRAHRTERFRTLRSMLDSTLAHWQRLNELVTLYEESILPAARENVEATLQAYESDTAVFDELVRAEQAVLDARLQALRFLVDRAAVQAELLYLAGDTP